MLSKIGNALNDHKLNLNTGQSKVPCMDQILTTEAHIVVRFALRLTVSEIKHVQCHQISEMHQMTSNCTWTVNSQKYSIYTAYLPPRPTFSSILLYDQPFPRYKVAKNRKCTECTQTELEHLIVKSILYTSNT